MGEKYVQEFGQKNNDLLKTKKMRNARTINLAVVSRRDLYYVSENTSFCFGEKWAKIGNRSQTSCVNEKGGRGGGGAGPLHGRVKYLY